MKKSVKNELAQCAKTKIELLQEAREYIKKLEELPNDVLYANYYSNSEYNEEYFTKPTFPKFEEFNPYGDGFKINGKKLYVNEL